MSPCPHTLRPCGHKGNSSRASVFPQVAARAVRNQGPAADGFLRVRGRKQTSQIPRGRQTVSAEPLENPPVGDDFGRTYTAIAADGERQETVREDLGVRDTAGLAVGELFSLTKGAEAATTRRTKKTWRDGAIFLYHNNTRCVPDADQYLMRGSEIYPTRLALG